MTIFALAPLRSKRAPNLKKEQYDKDDPEVYEDMSVLDKIQYVICRCNGDACVNRIMITFIS